MKINVMENRERRVNKLCKMLENISLGLSEDSMLQMMIEDYLEEEENIFTWEDIKDCVNDLLETIKDQPKEAYRNRYGQTWKCYNGQYTDGIEEVDLNGKHVVVTGTLSIPRKTFVDRLKSNGAIVSSGGISGKTDYLILGKDGGSKVKTAMEKNVPIIKEEVVNRWLEKIESPQLQEVAVEYSDPREKARIESFKKRLELIEKYDNEEDIEF